MEFTLQLELVFQSIIFLEHKEDETFKLVYFKIHFNQKVFQIIYSFPLKKFISFFACPANLRLLFTDNIRDNSQAHISLQTICLESLLTSSEEKLRQLAAELVIEKKLPLYLLSHN